ncbi:hypothetical protein AYI69_g3024 [Smittium culicis]|uniref:MULE transposase domain-containing protein n=1 Tax=Smittium culicis TaxID=133412 RepID=A0A1R1YKW4_9FUNG|nr:hypothetical protein AYI69_g3024 [Smittium culicis]
MTYKFLDLGNPIFILGISDPERHFTPLIVGILPDESEKKFLDTFNEIKIEMHKYGYTFRIDCLVSDSAPSFTSTLKKYSPDSLRVNC